MEKSIWDDPIFKPYFAAYQGKAKKPQVSLTGMGPGGTVDPNKPVDMINTTDGPKMLHEGELRITLPDGRFAVVPAKDVGPAALQQIQGQAQVGGYAAGKPLDQVTIDPKKAPLIAPIVSQPFSQAPAPGGTTTDSAGTTIMPILQAPTVKAAPSPATSAPQAPPSGQFNPQDVISSYAQGNGPYIQAITNQTLQNQGAAAAAGTAALGQKEAMAGMSPEATATAEAVRQRDVESQLGKTSADLATQAESTQLGAATTLQQIKTQQEQTQYDRNMALVNTQLNAGDYTNAAETLKTLYPTSKIDFSSLITAKNQAQVASAVSTLANYASTPGMTFDEAYNLMDKTGALAGTNLSKTDAQKMFQADQIQSDPIASLFANVSDSSIKSIIGEAAGSLSETDIPEIRHELGMLALTGGFSPQTGIDASKLTAAKYPKLYQAFGETATGEAAGYSFDPKTGRSGDKFTFKDAASGKTITKTLDQVQNNQDFATLAGVPYKPFTPDAGTWSTDNSMGMFDEAGRIWKTSAGTKQTTQTLSPGERITLGSDFTVQNSSVNVPAGNYVVNTDKTITAVGGDNDGKTYVITKNKQKSTPATLVRRR